ncbi:hypothetical protein B0F90DRAFT_1627740 [Multifurca ochricompacta]|uniref:Uncharacterized protein n=1 Tax=Multifurca ochricompacta TaxID=376703 RepID=A0AAD4QMQ4_9AGAM|nr:hypothetical protein B0F90DRAFT_1627740 [Multifurca ochricompacta]
MSARFVHAIRPRQLTTFGFSPRSRHIPSSSRVITTALTFDASACFSSDPSPTDLLVAAKTRDLLGSLEKGDSNPSRPWSHYIDLLNYMGLEKLPLEVHQLVLRKCVPPSSVIRAASARENRAKYYPHAPHAYENRLQTIMKNIRSAGWRAELDDYHFILEQFAAVGHYIGSRRVFQEMVSAGVEPHVKTYSLCLQALAHRLVLPCPEEHHPALIDGTTKMVKELIRDMVERKMPFTSVNMDLVIRILRETVDQKGFDDLIKFSYGIDLAYPDRLPLEIVERQATTQSEISDALHPPSYRLQPLSTPGLNVIVDMLGHTGRITKMVQAFEVLSQPLPKSSQSPVSLFDEDEDDCPIDSPSTPESIYPLPFAPPNTTTFKFLIKHAARANHAVFARHYLVQAMRLDREEDRRLRRDLCTLPVNEISAPLVAVNRNMFLTVFGLSNREKRVELMRWTLRMIRRTLRRKRRDMYWYAYKRDTRYPTKVAAAVLTPLPTSSLTSSSSSVASAAQLSLHSGNSESSVFDLDLDSDHTHSTPPPRIFDINTHISLLRRDIEQLEQLGSDVEVVLGRTIHRIKERLGRRVWSGKDIWLADDRTRTHATKEFWKEAVNFVVPKVTKHFRRRDHKDKKRP